MPEVTLTVFLSRLREMSSPRLPAFPFTLILPLRKSSWLKEEKEREGERKREREREKRKGEGEGEGREGEAWD